MNKSENCDNIIGQKLKMATNKLHEIFKYNKTHQILKIKLTK